jgi:hypothetical protein
MLAEISAAKRKNIQMTIKIIITKLLKRGKIPNNEQSLIMMAKNTLPETRIMKVEEREVMRAKESQFNSQVKSNMDTAHFQSELQFSE